MGAIWEETKDMGVLLGKGGFYGNVSHGLFIMVVSVGFCMHCDISTPVCMLFHSTAVKHGPFLLTLKERIQACKTKCMRQPLRTSYFEQKIND